MNRDDAEHCPVCGEELEYMAIPIFGDWNLGVAHEWLKCRNCGYKGEVK